MDVQQLEVKVFLADGAALDQGALIPIFHRWIQDDRLGAGARLIDVADYRHVRSGPGVMLVADGAQWRMDEAGGEVGLVYARKRDPLGPVDDKLEHALARVLAAARALEDERSLAGKLSFRGDRVRVTVMSRLAAGDGDYPELEAALHRLGERLHPGAELTVSRTSGPRQALAAELVAESSASAAELTARLG